MRNPQVHWYEGLFLRPHHLQAAERYRTELDHTAHRWDHPYHYGLHALEFSREALANGQFEVHRLHARMRDGTIVDLETGQEPDRLDLKDPVKQLGQTLAKLDDAFESETVVRIYIGIPKLTLGRSNVRTQGSSSNEEATEPRFLESTRSIPDESEGANDQEIQFRHLNVRLLLSTQDLAGYELLPIAQVKRAGETEAHPTLDTDFIPPLIAVSAWPPLSRDFVRAIFDIVGQKIETLSEQLVGRGIGLGSTEPGDAERVMLLGQLNEAYNTLGVLAFAEGVHPLVIYAELCRIVGKLALFTPARRAEELPAYDHEDLARIFKYIKTKIEASIQAVQDYEYAQRFFTGVGLGMQVSLEPQWLHSDWQWFIGVDKGELTQEECRELLSPGQLDWKFGSAQQVEVLFRRRAEGLQLTPVDRPIRELPARREWTYFEVAQREGPAWRGVVTTETLAMRLKDSLIVNKDRLQGEQRMVVLHKGRQVPLRFALFAVPRKS